MRPPASPRKAQIIAKTAHGLAGYGKVQAMKEAYGNIVILTGAGISAESGLPTFRDKDGLWEGHRVEEVATPKAFKRDPGLVLTFYNLRRAALEKVEPNPAHFAIARLQAAFPGKVTLITQNVDDLHERAGSTDVIHMHGELYKALCTSCEEYTEWKEDMTVSSTCPACDRAGAVRPDIVWFGEMPYHMDRIETCLSDAGTFVSIGTSGLVYPAAGFVRLAKSAGALTVEINNAGTIISGDFGKHITGPASVMVSEWVEEVVASLAGTGQS